MFRMARRVWIGLLAAVLVAWGLGDHDAALAGAGLERPARAVASDLYTGGAVSGYGYRLLVVRGRDQSATTWGYKLRFIDGTRIKLTIPKRFPGARDVLVGYELGPFAAINLPAVLTLATPLEVSSGACKGTEMPGSSAPCAVSRQDDASDARLTFWNVGPYSFATFSMNEWTLVFYSRPDPVQVREAVRSLQWFVDRTGFPTLRSSNAALDLRSPNIWMRVLTMPTRADRAAAEIIVTPGCREGDPSVFGPPDRFTCFGSAQVQVNRIDQSLDPSRYAGVQAR